MRPQSSGQESGSSEQKKSVFDRLGRQLDPLSRQMSRNSPANYPEHMLPPPSMQREPDFGRYGRIPEPTLDLNWRYQSERRHVVLGRERHHMQMPPPMAPRNHYEIDMQQSRQPPPPNYYSPHSQSPIYPNSSQPPGSIMLNNAMPIGVHQRRASPKYDRFGNPIRSSTNRMEHVSGMSPSRNLMPMGPMVNPGGPYDIPPMRPGPGMYHDHRWFDGAPPPPPVDMGPNMPPHGPSRLLPPPDEQFIDSHRYPPQPQQQQSLLNNMPESVQHNFEAPRYAKWRERRDVITNLDREAAQSSSRIDSMRSSMLQQIDKKDFYAGQSTGSRSAKKALKNSSAENSSSNQKKESNNSTNETTTTSNKQPKKKPVKTEPQDISDGEIIDDDEDSSDESESIKVAPSDEFHSRLEETSSNRFTRPKTQYEAAMAESLQHQQQPYYEAHGNKRLRLHEREDYSMDYETISDEELDAFMDEKKNPLEEDEKLDGEGSSRVMQAKCSSEIELLNALGLDWANLVEMSKQSRKDTTTSSSALPRFAISNYLPTLGITPELAGPKLYDLILKVSS